MSEDPRCERPQASERDAKGAIAVTTGPALAAGGDLDLCTPMRDHALCLARLREHVYGSRHADSLPATDCHGKCALGRWLCGEAEPYRTLPGFRLVEDAHAEFRRSADRALALLAQGRRLEATRAVETSGSVRQASRALVRALQALRGEIRATERQTALTTRCAEPAKNR